MTEKELKNKDSEKKIAPILLAAPVELHSNRENEQSGSRTGVESGANNQA